MPCFFGTGRSSARKTASGRAASFAGSGKVCSGFIFGAGDAGLYKLEQRNTKSLTTKDAKGAKESKNQTKSYLINTFASFGSSLPPFLGRITGFPGVAVGGCLGASSVSEKDSIAARLLGAIQRSIGARDHGFSGFGIGMLRHAGAEGD